VSKDDGVTSYELGEDTAGGLNTKDTRTDINKDDILGSNFTRKNTALDGSTVRNGLIRVDTLGRLLAAKVLFKELLDLGNTSGTTNENNFVDILLLNVGVLENLLNRLYGLPEEVHIEDIELLKFGSGKCLGEVIAVLEGLNFNMGGLLAGECTLGFLNLTFELSERTQIASDVCTRLLLVKFDEVVDDPVIEVLASQVGVTGGGQHLENAIVDRQEGYIKSTSTQVVDNDLGFAILLVQTVGDSSSGGLVDNTKDL
jgi:hypothetical protein